MDQSKIQLYDNQPIRTAWDEENEEWYFSIVDVIGALTDQPDARHASTYWAVMKKRLKAEGADQLLTFCKQLKMTATDGRKRSTDVANTEQLLRLKRTSGTVPGVRFFHIGSSHHMQILHISLTSICKNMTQIQSALKKGIRFRIPFCYSIQFYLSFSLIFMSFS